jgi:hypothetical protein
MADRYGFQFTKALVPEVFLLDGYMSAGPDGYVDVTNGTDTFPVWMSSIVRNSTGNYTVVLTDTWSTLPLVSVETLGAGATDHLMAHVFSVTTSGFSFVLENTTTGTATDLTTGGGIQFKVKVGNSTSL